MIETKICKVCNQELTLDNFVFDKRYNSYSNQCKKCRYDISKPRVYKNKEKIAKKK